MSDASLGQLYLQLNRRQNPPGILCMRITPPARPNKFLVKCRHLPKQWFSENKGTHLRSKDQPWLLSTVTLLSSLARTSSSWPNILRRGPSTTACSLAVAVHFLDCFTSPWKRIGVYSLESSACLAVPSTNNFTIPQIPKNASTAAKMRQSQPTIVVNESETRVVVGNPTIRPKQISESANIPLFSIASPQLYGVF